MYTSGSAAAGSVKSRSRPVSSAPAQAGRQGCERVARGGTRCHDYPRCRIAARAGLRPKQAGAAAARFPRGRAACPGGDLVCGRRHLHQLRGHHTGARAAASDSAAASPGQCVSSHLLAPWRPVPQRARPARPAAPWFRVASVTPLRSPPRGPRLPPTAGASVQPACLAPGPNQDPFQNSSGAADFAHATQPWNERVYVDSIIDLVGAKKMH